MSSPSPESPSSQSPAPESAAPAGWLVLEVEGSPDDILREAQVLLLAEGDWAPEPPGGVEEREGRLRVHLPVPSEAAARALRDQVLPRLQAELEALGIQGKDRTVTFGWQPHEAWAEYWRRGFGTRRITPRIVVTPTWEPVEAEAGEVVLVLDPGMAFGTSEHPTTRGCLRLMDARVRAGDRVADVGAGSGILAMAAAMLGAADVLALELDPWACAAARENAERNGVADRVRVAGRGVGPDFIAGEPPFQGIVANIETPILRPLVPGFAKGLEPGGWLILSGILDTEDALMTGVAANSGFTLEEEDREEGWWSGAFRLTASG